MNIVTQQSTIFQQAATSIQTADAIFTEALQIVQKQDAQLKAIQIILDAAGVGCWCPDGNMLTIPERVGLAVKVK